MQSAAFKQAYERLPSLSECQFIGIEAAISILLAKKYLVQADQKLSGFGTADEIASEAARLMTAAMSTASRMGSSRPRPGSLHPNLTGPFRGCSAATTPLCRKGRSDARSGGDDRGPRCSLTPNRTTVGASSQLLVLSGTRPTVSRVPAASASRRKVAKEGSRRRVDHDRRVTLPPSRRATAKLILTMFTVILAGCDDGHRSDPLLGRWEHDHPVSLFVLQFHRSEYYRELGGYSDKVTLKDEGGTYEAIGDYHFDQKSSPTKASPSSEPKGSAYAARHKIESARCWGASGGASTTREVDRAAAAPPSWPPSATNARFNV